MDTSETYIKMCEQSPLQYLWVPAACDYIYCRLGGRVDVLSDGDVAQGRYGHGFEIWDGCGLWCPHHDKMLSDEEFKKDHFCLFRQDQLQGVVIDEYVSPRKMLVNFGRYCDEYGDIDFSGEQLWHAFVVKEKYNKVWNGEDWVEG